MTEIVAKWVQNRLGLVIDMSPDNFAVISANGYLLAQLLHSYQIIVSQQLDLIVDSDYVKQCYENFRHINVWLKDLNITVPDEDLYEIVHGVGTASLHLFYRVFLELKDKTQLDFLTDNEIKFQLSSKFTRFQVHKVQSDDNPNKVVLQFEDLCKPLLAGGSVYHWYKDRMENLQNRCKDAREEYVHLLKTRCGSWSLNNMQCIQESGFVLPRSLTVSPRASFIGTQPDELPTEIVSYDDRSYDDLLNKQNEAKKIEPIKPDEKEVKKIMKHLKVKSKIRKESNILRNELNQEIMNEFDQKINMGKMMSQDRLITKIFMKQTLFEKELISKMGQVKLQKEFMVENKFKQAEVLNKLREKEFVDNLLLQDKELNEQKLSYYIERERVLQLHKKIWQTRLRLQAKRNEVLCQNTVKDIVNISIQIAEYKKRFHQEPTKREMDQIRKLFVSGQPAFQFCDPIDIIKKQDECEDDDEIEHIITQETLRQNAMDQEEFKNYIHYDCPWELTNIECTAETLEQIACGLNVLGHLVHQALLSKYPLPPIKERPYFPDAEIRVCINGLNDVACLPDLRNLLSKREIEVVELQNAVDFCLAAYHEENKREYDDEETISIKEDKKKKKMEKPPKKGEKSQTKKKGKMLENIEVPPVEMQKTYENKIVQTPIIYPCEEIEFSPQATLGKTAQDMLDLGLSLTDYLLVAIFVEYLKSIPNLKGWVLVNFPTTFEQAAILEEAFTGLSIIKQFNKPQSDEMRLSEIVDLEEDERSDRCSIVQELEMKRKSRLLPNPDIGLEPVKVYDTFLTAYIKIRKTDFDNEDGDSALPPVFEELGNEPDPLDKFYSDAGANYSMYYKEFDSAALKYLGKLIIGDYTLPIKTSVEIFGDVINYMEFGTGTSKLAKGAKRGEQAKKPREKLTKPPEDSEKKPTTPKEEKKGKKPTKFIIVHEDKYTQIPSEDEDEVEAIFVEENTVPITAGQANWVYTRIPLSEELASTLATLWEAIEEIYINDLKQVFFLKRINMNAIMPYVQYIKDIMKKDRPDYKGYYLAKFQKAFNVFEIDFRKDDEFKQEMYCRIEDFKEKLAELCDEKMMTMESERCKLIADNWAVSQMTELLNDYVNMFQIEMDRFTETFRFINNYYMIVFSGTFCDEDPVKDEYFAKVSDIAPEIINNFLQNVGSEKDFSFFENFLISMIQRASSSIKKVSLAVSTNIDKIKSAQISGQSSKSKASTPKGKASKDNKHATHAESDVIKENFDKLMEEWNCAIKGEVMRVLLRFDLLKHNALESFEEFFNSIQTCFHDIYNDIRENYWKEMENIKRASKIFHLAVENEKQVQKELVFVDGKFVVNPEVNLFDNDPIIPKKSKDREIEGAFTIAQLSKIADILMDLSPSGYMMRASFIFFLQDLIWNQPEDGSDPMAPPLWRKLDPKGIRQVVDELFDDLEYVYWRDFIIYNLRIAFPKERELLLTRKQLRECDPDKLELVKDYQFYGTKLWFEYLYKKEDHNKIHLLKRVIFKLYYIKSYGINYTAMLLDFCKDKNPIEGFAKALELSLGKLVCWDQSMGNTFAQEFLKTMREHDKKVSERDLERDEYNKVVYEELCKLVEYVVHIMEDVVVEDIDEEQKKDRNKETNDDDKKNTDPSSITKRSSKDVYVQSGDDEKGTIDETTSQNEEIPINKLYQEMPDKVGTDAVENLQVEFFLPVDVVITVITAALPWHSRVQRYEDLSFWERAVQIYETTRNSSFNNSVLSHEFLNNSKFLSLLNLTKKFLDMDPVRIVQSIVDKIENI